MSYKYLKDKRFWALVIAIFLLSFALGCDRNDGWSAPKVQSIASKESKNLEAVIPKASSSDERVVGFWNIQDLGRSKDSAEIDIIAEMANNVDLLVIVEVVAGPEGSDAVARLVSALNRKGASWDYLISDPTSGKDKAERYAYLWKSHRAKCLRVKASLLADVEADIQREPFLVPFNFDGMYVTFGAFHAVPTADNPEDEFRVLSTSQTLASCGSLIFGGDFNLPAKKVEPYLQKLELSTYIREKTSLGKKLHKDGSYLSKEYDHICTRGVEVVSTGVASHLAYLGNDLARAKQISDHLPVWMKFRLSNRGYDLEYQKRPGNGPFVL